MNQVLSWGVHAPRGRPLTALLLLPLLVSQESPFSCFHWVWPPLWRGGSPSTPSPRPALAWPGLVTLALSLPACPASRYGPRGDHSPRLQGV